MKKLKKWQTTLLFLTGIWFENVHCLYAQNKCTLPSTLSCYKFAQDLMTCSLLESMNVDLNKNSWKNYNTVIQNAAKSLKKVLDQDILILNQCLRTPNVKDPSAPPYPMSTCYVQRPIPNFAVFVVKPNTSITFPENSCYTLTTDKNKNLNLNLNLKYYDPVSYNAEKKYTIWIDGIYGYGKYDCDYVAKRLEP